MRRNPTTYSDIALQVHELAGLVGPVRALAMLVNLLEDIRDSEAFPRGLELRRINRSRPSDADLILMGIAESLATPRER